MDIKNKVVSVAVSASSTAYGLYRPDISDKSDLDDDDYEGAVGGLIANCWYVDYSTNGSYIYVFNGQRNTGTINLIVAAAI